MWYLGKDDLEYLFEVVATNYSKWEDVPDYQSETSGKDKLLGIFSAMEMDTYYPYLEDKAAYLLIGINKGHFFSNGNKRLSIVCLVYFIFFNNVGFKILAVDEYKKLLLDIFPTYHGGWQDFSNLDSRECVLSNLSFIIADNTRYDISYEELKVGTVSFLKKSLIEGSEK